MSVLVGKTPMITPERTMMASCEKAVNSSGGNQKLLKNFSKYEDRLKELKSSSLLEGAEQEVRDNYLARVSSITKRISDFQEKKQTATSFASCKKGFVEDLQELIKYQSILEASPAPSLREQESGTRRVFSKLGGLKERLHPISDKVSLSRTLSPKEYLANINKLFKETKWDQLPRLLEEGLKNNQLKPENFIPIINHLLGKQNFYVSRRFIGILMHANPEGVAPVLAILKSSYNNIIQRDGDDFESLLTPEQNYALTCYEIINATDGEEIASLKDKYNRIKKGDDDDFESILSPEQQSQLETYNAIPPTIPEISEEEEPEDVTKKASLLFRLQAPKERPSYTDYQEGMKFLFEKRSMEELSKAVEKKDHPLLFIFHGIYKSITGEEISGLRDLYNNAKNEKNPDFENLLTPKQKSILSEYEENLLRIEEVDQKLLEDIDSMLEETAAILDTPKENPLPSPEKEVRRYAQFDKEIENQMIDIKYLERSNRPRASSSPSKLESLKPTAKLPFGLTAHVVGSVVAAVFINYGLSFMGVS